MMLRLKHILNTITKRTNLLYPTSIAMCNYASVLHQLNFYSANKDFHLSPGITVLIT